MAKNIHEEKEINNDIKKTEPPHLPHTKRENKFSRISIFVCLIIFLAFLACLSMDLHQTKVISNEILPQMRADYDTKIDLLESEIGLLQREINKLKADNLHESNVSESYVDNKIEQLKATLSLADVSSIENNQVAQNAAKIIALEKAIETLHNQTSSNGSSERFLNEIMLASGALTVRGLAENNESFVYEAEVLQILAQDNSVAKEYVADIKKYAVSGISGKAMLIKSFDSFYPTLGKKIADNEEEIIPEDEKWYEMILRKLKNLVTFRKTDTPVIKFDTAPDEIYVAVNEGNLAEAVKRIKTSSKYMQLKSVVLEEWLKQTEDYLSFEHSVNGLIMNSLANIRMKEFQHTSPTAD